MSRGSSEHTTGTSWTGDSVFGTSSRMCNSLQVAGRMNMPLAERRRSVALARLNLSQLGIRHVTQSQVAPAIRARDIAAGGTRWLNRPVFRGHEGYFSRGARPFGRPK